MMRPPRDARSIGGPWVMLPYTTGTVLAPVGHGLDLAYDSDVPGYDSQRRGWTRSTRLLPRFPTRFSVASPKSSTFLTSVKVFNTLRARTQA